MKMAITSKGTTLDDQVDPRFGRCAHFVIVETDDLSCEAVENSNAAAGGGAGIQSAQLVAEKHAEVVLTGNCGPNAFKTLEAAGIEVVIGARGTVREAIAQYQAGKLSPTGGANVESHAGASQQTESVDMRIAIPMVEGKLSAHFGHCEAFALADANTESKTITSMQTLTPPAHEPGVLPRWLAEQGANLIIAGGMGNRAQGLCEAQNIKVIVGAPTDTPEVIIHSYLNDSLTAGTNICDH
jgi:predicted Fe-Mo cluster-binding NifX family protein